MNSLDIAIATPLLYGLIKGFSNGLIKEITDLLSLVLGIYIAVNFSIFLEPHLSGLDNYEQFKPILAFAILFVVTIFIVKFIGILVNKITKVLSLGFISRIESKFNIKLNEKDTNSDEFRYIEGLVKIIESKIG